jgi:hypothetical protein
VAVNITWRWATWWVLPFDPAGHYRSRVTATADQRNHARHSSGRPGSTLASAEDSLAAGRHHPAAGDAIHAGPAPRARDGITARPPRNWPRPRESAPRRRRRPDRSVSSSPPSDVEYGVNLVTAKKAELLSGAQAASSKCGVRVVRLGR